MSITNLRQFIKEYLIETKKQVQLSDKDVTFIPAAPQAPETQLLGKYAFATSRDSSGEHIFPDPVEVDTQYEKTLLKAIVNHLGWSNEPLSPEHTKNIKRFMQNGFYKKIFKSPPPGLYYRGETATTTRLKTALGLGPDDQIEERGEQEVNYMWTPKASNEHGSSWSKSLGAAKKFCTGKESKSPWGVVFVTSLEAGNTNFFSIFPEEDKRHSGLYRIAGGMRSEEEAISLGTVPVTKVIWKLNDYTSEQVKDYDYVKNKK